jgi:hypothetical protein
MQAFALVGIDGEVHAVMEDRQKIVDYLATDSLGALYNEDDNIVEFEYNDEPMTARGQELVVKIQELMQDVRKIHMNRQVGFYEMHVDDRLQLIYDMLTKTGNFAQAEPFSFNDSHKAPRSKQPSMDVERWEPTLDAQLETEGLVCQDTQSPTNE